MPVILVILILHALNEPCSYMRQGFTVELVGRFAHNKISYESVSILGARVSGDGVHYDRGTRGTQ